MRRGQAISSFFQIATTKLKTKEFGFWFLVFSHWLIQCKKQILPLLELAMVEAIASCVASVTTDTSKGEVQSEKKII